MLLFQVPTAYMCLVWGDSISRAFHIKINRKIPIYTVKEMIKDARPDVFGNIVAVDLGLWSVTISDNADDLENVSLDESLMLRSTRLASEYLPRNPCKRCIHIIVKRLPTSGKVFLLTMLLRSIFVC